MNHLIIDGFNLAFRAHYAFITLQTVRGLSSGCVYGFLVGIRTIKNKYPDCHITIAWDTESTRRKSIDAGYKANRPKFELSEQILDLKKIFSVVNASQSEYQGDEADDVIASLVKKYQEPDNRIFIYTSDKDMMVLVKDGRVLVIRPKRSAQPEKVFDEAAVKEEFGVCPGDLESFLCFKGDSVDNIPGIPRVKASCLADLVKKYRTPQNVYLNLQEERLTPFQRQMLASFEDRVYTNISLVRLRNDLELEIKQGTPDEEQLGLLLNKYEIRSLNPNTYLNTFKDISTFNSRTAPAIKCYSLFEEEK